jgi:hypothetical protein
MMITNGKVLQLTASQGDLNAGQGPLRVGASAAARRGTPEITKAPEMKFSPFPQAAKGRH